MNLLPFEYMSKLEIGLIVNHRAVGSNVSVDDVLFRNPVGSLTTPSIVDNAGSLVKYPFEA